MSQQPHQPSQPLHVPQAECEQLLRRRRVGRIAVCSPDGPHVVPVNYTVVGSSIVVRTSPYSVVGTYARDTEVAFEVDDIEGAIAELKAKNVKLQSDTWRNGHAGSKIVFLDPAATGNMLIELAELPAGH